MADGVLLFHNSDAFMPSFAPDNDHRPLFYWFSDRYHHHVSLNMPCSKYFYIFLVKPDQGVKLFTRHGKGDFASMWDDYDQPERDQLLSDRKYVEPGIVFSFDTLSPTLIFETEDDFTFSLLSNSEGIEGSFKPVVDGIATPFKDIPGLVELCPEILNAVPVALPGQTKVESFWTQDTKNAGRMWL